MSDVRALLRAKREEQRIAHPFASYNQSGALRCIVCGVIIKHSSAWNGHLGSKAHRTNAARLKEEERLREEKKIQGKRKSDEAIATDEPAKRRRVDEDIQASPILEDSASGFPADFFSDPSRTLDLGEADSDDDVGKDNTPSTRTPQRSQTTLDLEWAAFQKTVINVPVDIDTRETFDRATVFAEPQLSTEIPEGFPSFIAPEVEPKREASPVLKDKVVERRRRAEEEKELIMDRLLDEERAQEEADERVNALKAKLDILKQKRVATRAAKAKT